MCCKGPLAACSTPNIYIKCFVNTDLDIPHQLVYIYIHTYHASVKLLSVWLNLCCVCACYVIARTIVFLWLYFPESDQWSQHLQVSGQWQRSNEDICKRQKVVGIHVNVIISRLNRWDRATASWKSPVICLSSYHVEDSVAHVSPLFIKLILSTSFTWGVFIFHTPAYPLCTSSAVPD